MARKRRRLAKTKTNKQVISAWTKALDAFARDMKKAVKKL